MPDTLFRPRSEAVKPSFEGMESLALEFQTSLTATAVRSVECTPHRCALVDQVRWDASARRVMAFSL